MSLRSREENLADLWQKWFEVNEAIMPNGEPNSGRWDVGSCVRVRGQEMTPSGMYRSMAEDFGDLAAMAKSLGPISEEVFLILNKRHLAKHGVVEDGWKRPTRNPVSVFWAKLAGGLRGILLFWRASK